MQFPWATSSRSYNPALRQPHVRLIPHAVEGRTNVNLVRCEWAVGELLAPYHDNEWGVPHHDDRGLFELLN